MGLSTLKALFVCQSCGYRAQKWLGKCPGCAEWGTLLEEARSSTRLPVRSVDWVGYPQVGEEQFERFATGNPEFDRVLGGGIVPGSLILLGGEPGVGKSTLLLQVAETLSQSGMSILYVAGEESPQQIKLRGDRLGIQGRLMTLVTETSLERIIQEAPSIGAGVVIVDSIQTLASERVDAVPGSISQVRECAAQLLGFAKNSGVAVILVGHITKDGSIAGPKALEHIVDVVLYFEGEKHQNHKIIRAVKNRFGPANELGLFEMTGRGLLCIENPSQLFLSQSPESLSGSVVTCSIEGSRPVLVEIQALVGQATYSSSRRTTNGVDPARVALLLAMLEKRVGLQLLGCDVFVNVAGGLNLSEPAIDLAMVGSIVSSFNDRPLLEGTVYFGEIGLGGEIRSVNQALLRVREAASLGFKRVVLPSGNLPLSEPVARIELTGVSSVGEFLEICHE